MKEEEHISQILLTQTTLHMGQSQSLHIGQVMLSLPCEYH